MGSNPDYLLKYFFYSKSSVFWFNVRRTDLFCLVFYLTLSTQVMKPLIIIKHWRLLFDDYGTGYMSAIKFIKTRQSLLELIFEKLVLFIMELLFLSASKRQLALLVIVFCFCFLFFPSLINWNYPKSTPTHSESPKCTSPKNSNRIPKEYPNDQTEVIFLWRNPKNHKIHNNLWNKVI